MADFDARQMFDSYLYDYFLKKNLPELAETFKKEANLEIDPNAPPVMDVPEGFLLEWWKVSCDFPSFRGWLNQRLQEKSPSTVEATQEHDESQSAQNLMRYSEINKQLLLDHASGAMFNGSMPPGSALHKGDGSTSEATLTTDDDDDDDDDTIGLSDRTNNIARLSTASDVPTVHQLDSGNKK